MHQNAKLKMLKHCQCRQCRYGRRTACGQQDRNQANRRIRRLFSRLLVVDEAPLSGVQSMDRF